MASKKDKDTKSRKRDKPEEKEWEWEDTLLKDSKDTKLLAEDVKQLLITRGEKKQNLKGKKVEMIEFLKEKYDVELKDRFEDLTCKELVVELRLRGLYDGAAKKNILVQRLKGEIDASAPPPKKAKRGKKPKASVPKVFVPVYTPAVDAENTDIVVLGVFKNERAANEKAMKKLMRDLQEKLGDKKEKQYETTKEKIDEVDEEDFKKRLEVVSEAVNKAYGGEDDAPYCEISSANYVV
eukprot:203848_1